MLLYNNGYERCMDCEGTGRIYNNADPTSGQWVECECVELISKAKLWDAHKPRSIDDATPDEWDKLRRKSNYDSK